MRKDLTSEASRRLHRRRGRVLIAASAAVLIVGSALSMGIAVAWRHDRKDAAAKRFRADEQLLDSNVRAIAVSPDQKWIAVELIGSRIAVMPMVNGIPDIAQRRVINCAR